MARKYRLAEARKITPDAIQIFRKKTKLQLICDECDKRVTVGDYFAIYPDTKEFAGFRCKFCFAKLLNTEVN